jgi:hypothetical protein
MNDEDKIHYTRFLFGFLCALVSILLTVELVHRVVLIWTEHKDHSTMFEDSLMKQPPVSFKEFYEEIH